jgi:hypothetical protein
VPQISRSTTDRHRTRACKPVLRRIDPPPHGFRHGHIGVDLIIDHLELEDIDISVHVVGRNGSTAPFCQFDGKVMPCT